MIKDSKLIGTKIKAPYGWKKFKVGELFDCKPLNRPEIIGYTGYVKDDMVISPYGHTPYLAATSDNNGISGYSNLKANNKANVITLSTTADSSNTVFYQEQEFIGRQQMEGLRLKSKVLTKNLAFYFIPFIKKQACLFNYGNKLTVNKLKNFIIIVPVTSTNKPDFAWMEQYMKLVQEDYLQQKKLSNQAEIKAYLTESQTDSLDITDADRKFLHEFEKLPRREFKVGELFDVKLSQSDNKFKELPVGNIPLIATGDTNQGIVGYVGHDLLNLPPFKAGSITVNMFGKWFFQDVDFFAVAHGHINVLIPKHSMSDLFLNYICSVGNKLTYLHYGFSRMLTSKRTLVLDLELPVLSNLQVDVASIEKYMQIQSKPLINKITETLAPAGATN